MLSGNGHARLKFWTPCATTEQNEIFKQIQRRYFCSAHHILHIGRLMSRIGLCFPSERNFETLKTLSLSLDKHMWISTGMVIFYNTTLHCEQFEFET